MGLHHCMRADLSETPVFDRPLRWILLILGLSVGLTILFWGPLWQGSGLIGGDMYSYFFPQKAVYADQLVQGEAPLWNRLGGFGYPLLAESQTGVLYPPNPLLYRFLTVNTAYNSSQIAHYIAAFVFCWLLMRRLNLSAWAAALGAVVFVYGWFPPRICLEWAIIGGAYFPLCLWCAESYLQTRGRGWLLVLAAAMGIHLLAGHFNLAFITQLTVIGYVLLRLLLMDPSPTAAPAGQRAATSILVPVILAVAFGFVLSAVQLLPTWELKRLSQREEVGAHLDPGYGHIPPWYLSQIIAPWMWYTEDSDPDQALSAIKTLSIASATNKVEAHLYFGMLPLALIVYRLAIALRGGQPLDRRHLIWLLLGMASVIYATGWLIPLTRYLPGFGFFMGPGRYGIVTTFAAGLLAGSGFDQWTGRWLSGNHTVKQQPAGRKTDRGRAISGRTERGPAVGLICGFCAIVVIGVTVADLHWVSRRVTYAVMVTDPPINHRKESVVGRILAEYQNAGPELRPVRMWAPGANVASLTGFPTTPVYLGLGPAAYFDPQYVMPEPPSEATPAERRESLLQQKAWLRSAAVTHILRMEPLDRSEWPDANLVWQGMDRLLSHAWGRMREPLYLYEWLDSGDLARLEGATPQDHAIVSHLDAQSIDVQTSVAARGDDADGDQTATLLTIAQLDYPGWSAAIDKDVAPITRTGTADGIFLSENIPAGEHLIRWRFAPQSVVWGAIISLVGWGILLASAVRNARRFNRDAASGDSAPPTN
ncbi:MAG: hypothetical protein KF861_05980 [Planctomycetaceae bacterium]|nr:hypothetical protein [Planctomycetaceae bacterium]